VSITIIDAIESKHLFGSSPAFHDLASWRPWLTFLRCVYGLPLVDSEERTLFSKCTGRTVYDPPPGGWREVACIVGRQSGKTRVASLIVAFESVLSPRIQDGHQYSVLVAQDARASIRAAYAYGRSFFDASEPLHGMVTNATTDTLELENNIRIACYPCRPQSVRGLRARVVCLDELAFYRNSELMAVDREMLRAARPCLATTGGKLIILSSPYGQSGALWDLHRRHFGKNESDTLVWQSSAPEMNATLPSDYLDRMREDDPEAYRSEVLGEFRAGLSTLLDPDAIQCCVAVGRREQPPSSGIGYQAFVDPSGGRSDAFTVAIGHRDGDRGVVDVVRAWPAPFNPSGVVAECAQLLKDYRVSRVTGDRFAGEWPREAFRDHGVHYDVARLPKSDLYIALVAHVNGQRLELPDDPELLRELRGLERRRGPSGRDRVDHPAGRHDDRANAVAGLADLLVGRRRGVSPSDLFSAEAVAARSQPWS
jgi:hypothetical protein